MRESALEATALSKMNQASHRATHDATIGANYAPRRVKLTPIIRRPPCLRTASSHWSPGGAVVRPPTLQALRFVLIWYQVTSISFLQELLIDRGALERSPPRLATAYR